MSQVYNIFVFKYHPYNRVLDAVPEMVLDQYTKFPIKILITRFTTFDHSFITFI